MKRNFDNEGFFFLVLGFIFFAALFLGIRKFAAQAFKNTPSTANAETQRQIDQQQQRLERLKRDQESLMRKREQKVRDFRNR
jgi:hypothetical protein